MSLHPFVYHIVLPLLNFADSITRAGTFEDPIPYITLVVQLFFAIREIKRHL